MNKIKQSRYILYLVLGFLSHAIFAMEQIEKVSQAEQSTFEQLPNEIKNTILEYLVSAESGPEAIKNIRSFMLLNKAFAPFLNDTKVNGFIIQELANRYFNNDILEATVALGTNGAGLLLLEKTSRDSELLNQVSKKFLKYFDAENIVALKFILKYTPKSLIQTITDIGDIKRKGVTPLLLAIFANYLTKNSAYENLVQAIISKDKSQVDKLSSEGLTPFIYALQRSNIKVMRLLLNNGAEVNISLTYLPANHLSATPLIEAIRKGDQKIINFLIEEGGANVNTPNIFGSTPLKEAILKKDIQLIQLLLAEGAKVNTTDDAGNTALYYAISHKLPMYVIDWLISEGANVNIQNKRGETPLSLARKMRDPEIEDQLITILKYAGAKE